MRVPNPFISKLEHGAKLAPSDRIALDAVTRTTREVGAREVLVAEGDEIAHVHVVLSGFACRYKVQPNGGRQIVDYLVAGDACHLHTAIVSRSDHSIGTLSPCTVAEVPHSAIERLAAASPAITRALWWASLVSESVAREWIVNVGRRPADRRLAHLFCELFTRLRVVGGVERSGFDLPILQLDLADTLGITFVHANRMIKALRSAGLVVLREGRLTIPDIARLEEFAEFKANYLHLSEGASRLD